MAYKLRLSVGKKILINISKKLKEMNKEFTCIVLTRSCIGGAAWVIVFELKLFKLY